MTANDTISILVPIYNVDKYIKQCIESVINQTYTFWELILVDDGSTDQSSEICDSYANKDCRIKVVHKSNGGLASARNVGLENASGSWIMMLDGDDWISPHTLQKCIETAQKFNADFVKHSHTLEYTKRAKDFCYPLLKNKEEYIDAMLSRSISTSIWGGIYKRELFDKLCPKFTNGLNFGEDYSVTPRLLYVSQKPIFLQGCLYHYRILKSSYVGSHKWSNIQQLIECEKIIYQFFEKKDCFKYAKSLKKGRAWIKSLAFEYIVSDSENNFKHYEDIKKLYPNTVDYSEFNPQKKIFFILVSRRTIAYFISKVYPFKQKLTFLIKCCFGMVRG